jgi:hypothetical protein
LLSHVLKVLSGPGCQVISPVLLLRINLYCIVKLTRTSCQNPDSVYLIEYQYNSFFDSSSLPAQHSMCVPLTRWVVWHLMDPTDQPFDLPQLGEIAHRIHTPSATRTSHEQFLPVLRSREATIIVLKSQ